MTGPSEYVTVTIDGQLFGIPIGRVQDVFKPRAITRVPMAAPEIAGVLNLRGRIVTAIDMRTRLGLPKREGHTPMAVGIERNGEAYGLLIDQVGEVLAVEPSAREENPANLDPRWRAVSTGVFRLEERLLVVLDVDRLLETARLAA